LEPSDEQIRIDHHPFELRRLTKAEGGGWLITWPDLPGCMSDGETPEEAMENGKDTFAAWTAVRTLDLKKVMPKPASVAAKPARFIHIADTALPPPATVGARQAGRCVA